MEKKKDKQLINTPLSQTYLRLWGYFCSTYFGNDIYRLKEYVDLSINDFGEERVVEMLKKDEGHNSKRCKEIGENWEHVKKKLILFDKRLSQAKVFYDKIEKKEFKKISDKNVRDALKMAKKIPLIKPDIYTLAIFFMKNSSLQRMSIPSEAFKVMERSYKVVEYGKRPLRHFQNNEIHID